MVLPYINMNPPQVYTCSPFWTLLPPPSPYHPSGSAQCTSPKHPVSCIEPGLVTRFIYDIIHVSMPFSQIIPPLPSPTESKRLFYTSVSLLLCRIQGYCYRLSKFHIYALVYCIGVFLSGLLHSDPAISLLGIHTEETRIERDTCTPMFITALFIIARPCPVLTVASWPAYRFLRR